MKLTGLFARCTVFFVLSAISFSLYSQKNMLPGTVITSDADTLQGLVDYRNWGVNPDRIRFEDSTGQVRVFTPEEVVRFTVKDEVYVGAVVNTENSPTGLGALQELPAYSLDVDTVFLQAVIEGGKGLYYLKNKAGNNNFYIRNKEGFDLLLYKKYLAYTGGQQIIAEVKGYINQLLGYFSEYEALRQEILRVGYDWGSLERLFRHYYTLRPEVMTFSRVSEKLAVNTSAFTGLTLTSIILRSDYYLNRYPANYKPSADLSAGLALDLIFPRNSRKWSLNNEIQWRSWSVSGESVASSQNGNIIVSTRYDLAFSNVSVNSMVRFNYPAGRAILFVNAGISNSFIVGYSNHMTEERKVFALTETITGPYVEDVRRHEQSWLLGSGIHYGKFFLEYRHQRGNGISLNTKIFSATRVNSFWLGYRF